MTDHEIIVIGAGYAGIMSGKLLKEAKKDYAILEARDRIGGRVHAEKSKSG
jgi:monoamine oxidase